MKLPVIMPAWRYGNPLDIIDVQRALALRAQRKATVKPVRERKDKYYTQGKALERVAAVRNAKRGGNR